LKQEQHLKQGASEATELHLRRPGVNERLAGTCRNNEGLVEGPVCPASEGEASNQCRFNESLGAFTTRHSLLQASTDCLETGTSLVNIQAATTKFETHHNFDLFDGEEELPELLKKQELPISEDRQSEDHINSSLSEESLIMEFEARDPENAQEGPKESSLEGFDLPRAELPCSPYGKQKPADRCGVVDLDHYVIHKEEVILADDLDQQSQSDFSREDSLSDFDARIHFNFGHEQARSMRSVKIEQEVFSRIRPDPHQHFPPSEFRFASPLNPSHLINRMKTSSFDCIFNSRVVRRTKSVEGRAHTNNHFSNRF
jgi:hypothetical protein